MILDGCDLPVNSILDNYVQQIYSYYIRYML